MLLLNKLFFVFADKFDNIIKVFNIILSILFKAIANLANKVFNCITFIIFDNLLIEQAVYLKKFKDVSIAINTNKQ